MDILAFDLNSSIQPLYYLVYNTHLYITYTPSMVLLAFDLNSSIKPLLSCV